MFPTFNWQNFLQGLVPSLGQVLPQQQATFISPLTPPKQNLTVQPTAQLGASPLLNPAPKSNIATAPIGTSQGGQGSKPSAPKQNTPWTQPVGQNAPKPPPPTTPFLGETAAQAQANNNWTFGVAGFQMNTEGAGFSYSYDTDANGYAVIVSPDGYVQPITATDSSGQEFQPIATMSQQEAAYRAAELGVTQEEYIADLQSNGYQVMGDGTIVWAGGTGNVIPPTNGQQQPWWQAEGFSSEKKANKYYTEKKQAEKRARDANDPRKRHRSQGKESGGSGVTTATSFMGTG